METEDIKPGTVVVIADPALNVGGPKDHPYYPINPTTPYGKLAIVVVVQDVPGKMVGLCLKEPWEHAHECDGLVPMKHGVWSRPEYLQTPEQHEAHYEAGTAWREQLAAAKVIYEQFMAE